MSYQAVPSMLQDLLTTKKQADHLCCKNPYLQRIQHTPKALRKTQNGLQ